MKHIGLIHTRGWFTNYFRTLYENKNKQINPFLLAVIKFLNKILSK